MEDIIRKLEETGIIPVIALEDAKDASKLGAALLEGGLPCAEITFRTDAAKDAIRILNEEFPKMLVGAGTVLTTEQVEEAVEAGAKFVLTPGLNPKVVRYCVERNILIIPGCATPSDVEQALEFGLQVVKFFPAEPSGGLAYIQALSAPYKNVRYIPTGGLNPENVRKYLASDCVLACGGSWMVNKELLEQKKFQEVAKLAQEAVGIVKECRNEEGNKDEKDI